MKIWEKCFLYLIYSFFAIRETFQENEQKGIVKKIHKKNEKTRQKKGRINLKRIFSIVIATMIMALSSILVYTEPIEDTQIYTEPIEDTQVYAEPIEDTQMYAELIKNLNISTMRVTVLGVELLIYRDTTTRMPAYCLDYDPDNPVTEPLAGEFDPETIYDYDTYEGLKALLLAGYPYYAGGLSDDRAQGCTQLAVWYWTYEKMGYGVDISEFSLFPGEEYDFFMSIINAARNQTSPDLELSATDILMVENENILTGQTTVNFSNLRGGYTIDESVLLEGMTVSGYTGENGDVLIFTAPLSLDGQSFTINNILLGHDERMNLFWYDNKSSEQQKMVVSTMDKSAVTISADIKFTAQTIAAIAPYAEVITNPYLNWKSVSVLGLTSKFPIWTEESTKMPAYCLDIQKSSPSGELLAGELNPESVYGLYTEGLKDLLFAGYPFQTGGLSPDKAQGCTQMALWCWMREIGRDGLDYRQYKSNSEGYDFFMSVLNAGLNKTPPNFGLSAANVIWEIDGNTLKGQTTVTFHDLQGSYSIDKSKLPADIEVSGYTGQNGDVLTFTAPLSYANEPLTIDELLLGYDSRLSLNLFWYENKDPEEQNMVIPVLDQNTIAISAGITFTVDPQTNITGITLVKYALTGEDDDQYIDDITTIYLEGAEFDLYWSANGEEGSYNKVGSATTNDKGLIFWEFNVDETSGLGANGIGYGYFYVLETKAPDGYELLGRISDVIHLSPSNKHGRWELENIPKPDFNLPLTGGIGTILYTVTGLFLLGSSITIFLISRKKRVKQSSK